MNQLLDYLKCESKIAHIKRLVSCAKDTIKAQIQEFKAKRDTLEDCRRITYWNDAINELQLKLNTLYAINEYLANRIFTKDSYVKLVNSYSIAKYYFACFLMIQESTL